MRIAIAGAGAMGSRFGYMLSEAGNDVTLIDRWDAHVDAIRQNGLQIDWNGEKRVAHLPIVKPNEVEGPFELVICFTKAMGLGPMLEEIAPALGEDTYFLSLLNGLGHGETMKKYVPASNVLVGTTIWTARLDGPGQVHLHGDGSLALESLCEEGAEVAQKVAQVLDDAGLNATYDRNVKYAIYRKASLNGAVNGVCALLDANLAQYGESGQAKYITTKIVEEFAAVAKHEGVNLDVEEVIGYVLNTMRPEVVGEHYPSMHQDLVGSHRLTEIDYLNGAVARKAEAYGESAPYCDFLTRLVHAKESVLGAK